MFNLEEFAMNMIKRNPRVANYKNTNELISTIQSGDSARGEQIADNFCKTYGVTREQAIAQAKKFFGI